jgi:hypothetical protein
MIDIMSSVAEVKNYEFESPEKAVLKTREGERIVRFVLTIRGEEGPRSSRRLLRATEGRKP